MAKTTKRTAEARQRLLETATRLFYEEGYHATGIDRVLAEAGTAKMTLYNQFQNKEGLIAEVIATANDAFCGAFAQAVAARADDPRERLLAIFDVLAEWLPGPMKRGCPLLNAAVEFPDPAHPVRALVEDRKRRMMAYFTGLCREAAVPDPDALGEEIAVLYHGALAWFLITNDPSAARTARRTLEVRLAP
ncbi:MAG: TetR/AcrR family transcriptional regulator [Sumerlaeia bacterium]